MRHGYRERRRLQASLRGRLASVVAAAAASGLVAALSACGGSGATTSQGPAWPNGPWPISAESSYMEACQSGASDFYCVCTLKHEMRLYPNSNKLPGAPSLAASTDAQNKHRFPDCAGL